MTSDRPRMPTILVVDDHAMVRDAVVAALRAEGWWSMTAADASSAIQKFSGVESIDLVLSDIQMPGEIDGIGLARWVRENRPELPVILTTGGIYRRDQVAFDEEVIPKPYQIDFIIVRMKARLAAVGWNPLTLKRDRR